MTASSNFTKKLLLSFSENSDSSSTEAFKNRLQAFLPQIAEANINLNDTNSNGTGFDAVIERREEEKSEEKEDLDSDDDDDSSAVTEDSSSDSEDEVRQMKTAMFFQGQIVVDIELYKNRDASSSSPSNESTSGEDDDEVKKPTSRKRLPAGWRVDEDKVKKSKIASNDLDSGGSLIEEVEK